MAALIIFIMKRNNGNAGLCQDIMFPVIPVFLLLFFDKSKSGVIISKIIEIIRLWTVYLLIFRQKKSTGSEMSCEGSQASEREKEKGCYRFHFIGGFRRNWSNIL